MTKDIDKITNEYVAELEKKLLEKEAAYQKLAESHQRLEKDQGKLAQTINLTAMDELIGNIAHQWRQPLTTLSVIIQDIQQAYEYGELDAEYLDNCVVQGVKIAKSMSKTIDQFRNFFKSDKRKEVFLLKDIIQETLSIVEANLRHKRIIPETNFEDEVRACGFRNE